jgi:hypothetical protein
LDLFADFTLDFLGFGGMDMSRRAIFDSRASSSS